jgi:hypothetical protein
MEVEREAQLDIVSTITFIQANLQHSISASRALSRTVSVKGIDMAIIQETWYCEGSIRGLNIPGHALFSANVTDRTRVHILTRNETAWMLPELSCRDLVAVIINCNKERAERRLVVMFYICALQIRGSSSVKGT